MFGSSHVPYFYQWRTSHITIWMFLQHLCGRHQIFTVNDCRKLQEEINAVEKCWTSWSLDISVEKVLSRRLGRPYPHTSFSLSEATLNYTHQIRDLGIVYESGFNFDNYIHEITRKTSRSSIFILRAFKIRDVSIFFKLFNLLLSTLESYKSFIQLKSC